ncbi:MAG: hypothetical protein SFV55_05810 [Haliscomenobacter sp.]|uniref:hypothetical protein n=1 Tax=Haliscomenobacter sp. TaxID=2717303 RepID=UPI0029BEBE8C|nr:hypothetical protein [Haliscomenobacter sp.]MDX2067920.1 hypothetical protein [Haliscomenobacter sp.]
MIIANPIYDVIASEEIRDKMDVEDELERTFDREMGKKNEIIAEQEEIIAEKDKKLVEEFQKNLELQRQIEELKSKSSLENRNNHSLKIAHNGQ